MDKVQYSTVAFRYTAHSILLKIVSGNLNNNNNLLPYPTRHTPCFMGTYLSDYFEHNDMLNTL